MRKKYSRKHKKSTETEQNPIPQFYLPFDSGGPVPELRTERKREPPNRSCTFETFAAVDDALVCGVESADDDYWNELLEWVENNEERPVDRKQQ